jgi:hypothetical protein
MLRRDEVQFPEDARRDTISYLSLSTSAWAGATDRIQSVWARKKDKWAGLGRHLNMYQGSWAEGGELCQQQWCH